MSIAITVFANSPDCGRGLARDMPVRWALEEAGVGYAVRPVLISDLKTPERRARQPFGQIPVYEAGDLVLFESAAIVLHIAASRKGLLPHDENARARAVMWMFAAVSTIEPAIVEREAAQYLDRSEPWFDRRVQRLNGAVRSKLRDFSARLGGADWLDGAFSAGDLMMVSVLRRLEGSGLLEESQNLAAYVARGEARPAFRRAFDAQLKTFRETSQPAGD